MDRLKKIRSSDLLLACFIIATGAMLLVPLPTTVLDFLIVINLAVSLLLLLAGLYLPHALALLSFPSLLLLTTLFRIGINVASTRLILTQADAGQVIQAFGSYLVRGEVVVGLIIFFILTIVNFLVISRGAARVSEVAARFTLDALPGRQLSIDSDLRSGLISAEEAQRQRENLSKESQLYGSMDGAMRFVQGDAVVGLIIIFVNILGGMYLGVRSGLGFYEAAETYTILTIGDGLVNQIPAILIALCAGLVVTRVAAVEGVSLAEDVRIQVFAKPSALYFAAALLFVFGSLNGIPAIPFMSVALFLATLGYLQSRAGKNIALQSLNSRDYANVKGLKSDRVNLLPSPSSLAARVVILSVDAARLFPLWKKDQFSFNAWWEESRQTLSHSLGLPLPSIHIQKSASLKAGEYELLSNGLRLTSGQVPLDCNLFEVSPQCAELFGLQVLQAQDHPLFMNQVTWAAPSAKQSLVLQNNGIRVWNSMQVIGLEVIDFCRTHPEEFFSVSDILALEARLERTNPGLLQNTMPRQFFTTSRITEISQQLVRESVPIADFTTLIELLAQYSASIGAALIAEGEFDLGDVVSFIRISRRRHSLSGALNSRGRLLVIQADSLIEEQLADCSMARINELAKSDLPQGLREIVSPILNRGDGEALLVLRSDLKAKATSLLDHCKIGARVVTFAEVDMGVKTELIGVWRNI